VRAGHFVAQFLDFVSVVVEQGLLLGEVVIRLGKMLGNALGCGEICPNSLLK
jgi:hypothetical protein